MQSPKHDAAKGNHEPMPADLQWVKDTRFAQAGISTFPNSGRHTRRAQRREPLRLHDLPEYSASELDHTSQYVFVRTTARVGIKVMYGLAKTVTAPVDSPTRR